MSGKVEATYHGSTLSQRLRLAAPYTEDGPLMREAADIIEKVEAFVTEYEADVCRDDADGKRGHLTLGAARGSVVKEEAAKRLRAVLR